MLVKRPIVTHIQCSTSDKHAVPRERHSRLARPFVEWGCRFPRRHDDAVRLIRLLLPVARRGRSRSSPSTPLLEEREPRGFTNGRRVDDRHPDAPPFTSLAPSRAPARHSWRTCGARRRVRRAVAAATRRACGFTSLGSVPASDVSCRATRGPRRAARVGLGHFCVSCAALRPRCEHLPKPKKHVV